jgi:23S rRNA pseudouridine1911/1915/1917 synthase
MASFWGMFRSVGVGRKTLETRVFTITKEAEGERLDRFIVRVMPQTSRSLAARWIEQTSEGWGGVWVNDKTSRPSYRLRIGDEVVVQIPPSEPTTILPEAIPLTILYEDEELLVINKAQGMVVHPAPGTPHGTLVNAVLAHTDELSDAGGDERPGIVHRLDKDTSGLLVVAKTDQALRHLQAQLQTRQMERRYLAVVWGTPKFDEAIVDAPIGRHPVVRKKMAVIEDARHKAREAKTELKVLRRFGSLFTLLEAKLQTGRTHQIRVHCAYIHHPVVGDPVYGGERNLPQKEVAFDIRKRLEGLLERLPGQALHAYSLAFVHPVTGEPLCFHADPPEPMQALISALEEIFVNIGEAK